MIARILGLTLMPWQQYVIAVATEYDPATGRPYYRNVWITVPRQSGKSTLVLVLMVMRALLWTRQRISYTAQTAQDARKKLIEDWKLELQKTAEFWGTPGAGKPTGDALIERLREQNGSEGITFVNGSLVNVVATGRSSGHGQTLHFGVIDEAFHDRDLRREQAMVPAQNTIDDAQIVGLSTMGDADSVLLNARVKQGRAAVETGLDRTIAYFEWSAEPGTAIDDEDAWLRCMPAVGHTISIDTVRDALELFTSDPDLGPDEFKRAYLNIPSSARRSVFAEELYGMVATDDVAPAGRMTLALEATPERRSAAVAVADDDLQIELIYHRDGTGWVVDRVAELALQLDAPVAIDKGGPAGSFIDPLKERKVAVIEVGTRELTHACGTFYDAMVDRQVRIRNHPAIAEAVEKARQRQVSDAWAWARKTGDHDATPLMAMSLAVWGTSHHPDTVTPEVALTGDVDPDELDKIRARIEKEHAEALARIAGAA